MINGILKSIGIRWVSEITYQLVFNPHIDIYGGWTPVTHALALIAEKIQVTDKQIRELKKALQKPVINYYVDN